MGKRTDTNNPGAFVRSKASLLLTGVLLLTMILHSTATDAEGQSSDLSLLTSYEVQRNSEWINVDINKMPIELALRTVVRQANVGISYDPDLLPEKNVTAVFENEHVFTIVSLILEDTGLEASISPSGNAIVIKEAAAEEEEDLFQETVTGQIIDSVTGEALPGVNIVIQGTTTGVASDPDGNFSLEVPDLEQTLIFSFVGYQTQIVELDGRSELVVELQTMEIVGEDIVVVAFGQQSREEFVGSAVSISSRDFERRAVTNPTQIIEGTSPGVMISPGSGQPGSGSSIRIRGIGSVSTSNAPLIVVDGAIYPGQLSSVNPNDIESLTILKDAASTSLYGSGAANGVIMISTKQGRSESQVSVSMSQGAVTRMVPEYERVNSEEYYPLMWEAYRNGLVYSTGLDQAEAGERASAEIFSVLGYNPFGEYFSDITQYPVDNEGFPILTDIVLPNGHLNPAISSLAYEDDWQDEITRTGLRSNMEMSYSGRAQNTSYYASLGYLDETGYLINSDFERFNGRLKLDSDLSSYIKAGINLAGHFSESLTAHDGAASPTTFVNPYRATRLMGPIYPLFERDRFTSELINGGTYDPGEYRGEASGRHAVQENILNEDLRKNTNLTAHTYLDFRIMDNLNFRTQASFDRRNYNRNRYRNGIIGDAAPGGDAWRYNNVITGITLQQLLNYRFELNDHTVSGLLGHESFQYDWEYQQVRRTEQVVEGNKELINFVNLASGTSYSREYRKEGFFARANYDFRSRYYLSGSFRYDGSSRFESGSRWSAFWSLGAKWRVTQESFMRNISWIDNLELRASYGEVGNDSQLSHTSLSFYAYQPLYQLGRNNATEPGILLNTAGNPGLQWETNAQTDIALEFTVFNNRLTSTIEWYNRESQNLLFDVPLPLSSGIEDYPDNIGTMYNRGFELSIDAAILRGTSFQWNIRLHAATLTNRFKELPQEEIIDVNKKLVVGRSIYDYWLRDWFGVDPADGAGLYVATQEAVEAGGDDIREVDGLMVTTNHNNAERSFHGSAIPDLFGGISNTFSYKGFSLSALVSYQIGGKTYDSNYSLLMHPGSADGRALSRDILKRWQQPGDITDVPRLDRDQETNFISSVSSRWLVSSSFATLRNVNLSYDIPPALTTRIGVRNATVYINGENLLQFTARTGLEAAQQFDGSTQPRYTPSRVVSVGLNFTF